MESLQDFNHWLAKKPSDLERQYSHPSQILPSKYWEKRDKDQLLIWVQMCANAVIFNQPIHEAIYVASADFDDCNFFNELDIDCELDLILEVAKLSTLELLELGQWLLSLATEKYQQDIDKN